jgi:tungstate transport system substrate-binding protein
MRQCWVLGLAAVLLAAGCSRQRPASLTLATTTSTQDSGLLDVLVPLFRERTGLEVRVVAVGTGQALELGRRGDADALLVHDPAGEEEFMAQGFGALRSPDFYNDFVLVGPGADPAGVKGRAIVDAFAAVARRRAPFVSRGDESGTHARELALWRRAKVEPHSPWYIRAGSGMGAVLRLASEKRAYTLTDRATFLALKEGLDLAVLCEGGRLLANQYSVLVVSPEKHPHVREGAARKLVDFLLSPEGQKAVAGYGKGRFGQPLFFPGQLSSRTPR